MKTKSTALVALATLTIPLLIADDFDAVAAWEKDCTKCHAKDGSGLTKKGRKLRLEDYRKPETQAKFSDEELTKAIKEGIQKDGEEVMKSYADDYSDQEIEALVAYIRSLAT